MAHLLPPPARYFPASKGRYDVSPSLRALGTDFGIGAADSLAFQFDRRFPEYRENKRRVCSEAPERHAGAAELTDEVAEAVVRWMITRLTTEHPGLFHSVREDGETVLHCRLTGEPLRFDHRLRLSHPPTPALPLTRTLAQPYLSALDALCRQVQEDVAVVSTEGERNWLSFHHVCAPSHWRPESKRGLHFAAMHAPVPGMEPVNRVAGAMVAHMVRGGPWVRFVWGVDTHRGLNRHPDPPPGVVPEEWRSPPFDGDSPAPFTLRVERQVTWGLPEVGAAVFLIRPYQIEASELTREERSQLRAALLTMSPESRLYKGVASHWDELLAWLERS